MSLALQYKTIRDRLIDPPIKLTREVLEQKDAKIASLCRTIRVHEQMQEQKQSIIERLKDELLEARKSADTLQAELRKAHGRKAEVQDVDAACEAITNEVLKDWPDLTMTHIRNRRRAEHIVACRHACIVAIADRMPDLPHSAIARFMGMNDSSVRYAIRKHREAMGLA
jgi:chromosome segregation ATPase